MTDAANGADTVRADEQTAPDQGEGNSGQPNPEQTNPEQAERDESERIWQQLEAEERGEKAEKPESKPDEGGAETPKTASGKAAGDKPAGQDKPAVGQDRKPNGHDDEIDQEIWAGATPRQIHEFKSLRGRYLPLQRRVSQLTEELRAHQRRAPEADAKPDSRDGKTAAAKPALSETFETAEWKQFEDLYPEAAKAQRAAIEAVLPTITTLESKVDSVVADRDAARAQSVEDYITSHHPEFYTDIVRNKDFFGWVDQQPAHVKNAVRRNSKEIVDPEEVIAVVSLWKDSRAPTQSHQPSVAAAHSAPADKPPTDDPRRRRQLAAADAPAGRSAGALSDEPPRDASPEELWAYFDEQDRKAEARRQAG